MAEEFIIVPIADWDSHAKCPKCESDGDDLTTNWNKTGGGKVNGMEYQFDDIRKGMPFEHLEIGCKKCGYQWLMETADAEARKEAMEKTIKALELDQEDDDALKEEKELEVTPAEEDRDPKPQSLSDVPGHLRRIKGGMGIPPL